MKKLAFLFLALFAFALWPPESHAASVTLTWDPVTTNSDGSACTDLDHYELYKNNSAFVSVAPDHDTDGDGNPDITVTASDGDKFYVTAIDHSGNESGPSNVVTIDMLAPASCTNLKVRR
jgi:fibronectin type 3 domain-containing protein